MKTLSVLEPWASGIIFGTKRIENRTWRTLHRGPILIHAGKSRRLLRGGGERGRFAFGSSAGETGWMLRGLLPGLRSIEELRFGQVIGMVDVVDCVPVADVAGEAWAEGPWCWVLERPRPIEPFAWRGQLMLFEVPDRLVRLKAA